MGVSAQTKLQPLYAAALRGSNARFNCSTPPLAPTVMIWTVNKLLVVTILEASVVLNSTDRFSVRNFTTPGNYTWEFTISNVQRSDIEVACQVMGAELKMATMSVQERGSVEIVGGNLTKTEGAQTEFQCRAVGWFPEPSMSWSVNGVEQPCNSSSMTQGSLFNSNCTLTVTAITNSSVQCLVTVPALTTPESNTVFLTVNKNKTTAKRDQTVLIAVTVAFSAAALLFLIIYGIIFFCLRRKKKSSYEEEVARARVQSQNKTPATQNVQGQDNQGYNTDGHDGHTNGGVWFTNNSNESQILNDFFEDGPRKQRHMTTV
ncbi:hypothetical protein R3I94_020712 [Phoxinus phoxinus]|uniref:Ig-like domain-containing protein n=1 Tax=Phoxinus phoxinus TaxID=58324 RepID=A0AAN9GT89_9TELE